VIDRRAVFFLISAAVVAGLAPIVPYGAKPRLADRGGMPLAIALVVLALLSFLDHWSRRTER
jgi:hypothetical protein